MNRLRPGFAVCLVLAAVGAGSAAVLPAITGHLHEKHEGQAFAVAHALEVPAGAVDSTVCRGDGQVACWETSEPVAVVANMLLHSMEARAGKVGSSVRYSSPITTTGSHFSADSHLVRVNFGSHSAMAWVEPIVERDADGVASVIGARVSLNAG
ncbi:hypothetical protein CLV92_1276 [Kineococcus xinjiangensis]|uniref:Uncharacterized protein n=1 Tax=Kineococcus xinjiangensis TaxID=512762 RepID=A0A2S6IBY9_9ACTN|nr:hypothetical protein [Kineococcus xinjiangensis]PPK90186.1 hypothetical protein CLV92_1276 [Kineococcus xinjiangensis]